MVSSKEECRQVFAGRSPGETDGVRARNAGCGRVATKSGVMVFAQWMYPAH